MSQGATLLAQATLRLEPIIRKFPKSEVTEIAAVLKQLTEHPRTENRHFSFQWSIPMMGHTAGFFCTQGGLQDTDVRGACPIWCVDIVVDGDVRKTMTHQVLALWSVDRLWCMDFPDKRFSC